MLITKCPDGTDWLMQSCLTAQIKRGYGGLILAGAAVPSGFPVRMACAAGDWLHWLGDESVTREIRR
jgi:hypothetical protein